MRFSAMWNPLSFVGYEIATKTQIEQTVRELYNSKPHVGATLGFAIAGLSAAMSGSPRTGIAATLIVFAGLLFRIFIERRFLARSADEPISKWIRLFVAGSMASGLGWGLSGAILLYDTSPETQTITMAVACAIAHGAAGRAYMMPGTALFNISLLFSQMSIGACANGNYIYVPAFLLYFVFLTSFIVQMVNNRMSQLRAEQMAERLLQEITTKNDLLRVANETLAAKAYQDPLTGLANRRKFDAALAETLATARRDGTPVSLMMIDVDHFKAFNDTYGHQSGDECLQRVSRAISDTVAGTDSLVARYGGEEFIVFLEGVEPAVARVIAERICLAVRLTSLEELPNSPPRQTISIGLVSSAPDVTTTPSLMLAAADAALYEAKKRGRNRVCVHRSAGEEEDRVLSLDAVQQA